MTKVTPVPTTCGVLLVTPGHRILLGRATGSLRWDIPKGIADPGESWIQAALRELREETGLDAFPSALAPLGLFDYLPKKNLALFSWHVSTPIDPSELRCTTYFTTKDGRSLPEMSGFALLTWEEALGRVGKSMARILAAIDRARLFGVS